MMFKFGGTYICIRSSYLFHIRKIMRNLTEDWQPKEWNEIEKRRKKKTNIDLFLVFTGAKHFYYYNALYSFCWPLFLLLHFFLIFVRRSKLQVPNQSSVPLLLFRYPLPLLYFSHRSSLHYFTLFGCCAICCILIYFFFKKIIHHSLYVYV